MGSVSRLSDNLSTFFSLRRLAGGVGCVSRSSDNLLSSFLYAVLLVVWVGDSKSSENLSIPIFSLRLLLGGVGRTSPSICDSISNDNLSPLHCLVGGVGMTSSLSNCTSVSPSFRLLTGGVGLGSASVDCTLSTNVFFVLSSPMICMVSPGFSSDVVDSFTWFDWTSVSPSFCCLTGGVRIGSASKDCALLSDGVIFSASSTMIVNNPLYLQASYLMLLRYLTCLIGHQTYFHFFA